MTKDNFFNELAEKWDAMYQRDTKKIQTMIDLLVIKNEDKILDVGCGTGILIPFLAEKTKGANITAIDSAKKMIETAKQKFLSSNVNFISDDVFEYKFTKESFNHIICYSVFPHFDNKKNAIKCFSKLLKSDGLLSILHSESKEVINRIHLSSVEVSSDSLKKPAEYISFLHKAGLYEEIIIDNSEMYMLCARKR